MAFLQFKSNETFYYSNLSNVKNEDEREFTNKEGVCEEGISPKREIGEDIYSNTHVWYYYNNVYKKMEICEFKKEENLYSLKRKGRTLENVPAEDVIRCLKDSIELDSENNIDIIQLNEVNVLENLKNRYKKNKIYTFHGSLLLAVNPYTKIKGLYDIDCMNIYLNKFKSNQMNMKEDCKTHIYDIGNMAYKNMVLKKKRQTIVVSGHSGSGKTENCKFLFRYFHYIFFHKDGGGGQGTYKSMNSYADGDASEENISAVAGKKVGTKNDILGSYKKAGDDHQPEKGNLSWKEEKSKNSREKINELVEANETINYERIDKLIYINSIIESMSNAKTIKNNNSSRCGRINDLIFEEKKKRNDDTIFNYCFSNIKIFILLLEINRCISQNIGERNFHIFYELIWGLTDEQLRERNLVRDVHQYKLMKNYLSKDEEIKGVKIMKKGYSIEGEKYMESQTDRQKDEKNFQHLLRGLRYIKYDEVRIGEFFDALAGIIHLGEIDTGKMEESNSSKEIQKSYKYASECLKIRVQDLLDTIKYRNIHVSCEKIRTNKSRENAQSTLNTLIKVIYKNIFSKIIYDINMTNLSSKEREEIMNEKIYVQKKNIISILDLYGFEDLSCNNFEQVCINLANEKLNNYYINNEIDKEKNIYKSENILWNDIIIPNYKDTILFIEKMFSTLDDITKLNSYGQKKGDDNFFTCLLNGDIKYLHNGIYGFLSNKDGTYTSKKENIHKNKFFIKHYAGCVTYTINKWIHKNCDRTEVEIEELIDTSGNSFLGEKVTGEKMLKMESPGENEKKQEQKGEYAFTSHNAEYQLHDTLQTRKDQYYMGENLETMRHVTINENDVIRNDVFLSDEQGEASGYKKNITDGEDVSRIICSNLRTNTEGGLMGKKVMQIGALNRVQNGISVAEKVVDSHAVHNSFGCSSNGGAMGGSGTVSVSRRYTRELDNLFSNLQRTDMYYIRCILPNEKMAKNNFKRKLVYSQLKQCGANEIIKIVNNGLSHKMAKEDIFVKCKKYIPKELLQCRKDDIVYYFMRLFDDEAYFRIGKNYIFMKSHVYTRISYQFYDGISLLESNNSPLCDSSSLVEKKKKEILKEIQMKRFRRCVTTIKVYTWIIKHYIPYLQKKREMKRKICDYMYKMYLVYKTMISVKKRFSYNMRKLNKIMLYKAYKEAFKRIKNARRKGALSRRMNSIKKGFEAKSTKIEPHRGKEPPGGVAAGGVAAGGVAAGGVAAGGVAADGVEAGGVEAGRVEAGRVEAVEVKNDASVVEDEGENLHAHNGEKEKWMPIEAEEIFVSTPDNYHYVYNNLDWVVIYMNGKIHLYNILYGYERVKKRYILNYDSIAVKKVDFEKYKEWSNEKRGSETKGIQCLNTSTELQTTRDEGEMRAEPQRELHREQTNSMRCHLSKSFCCMNQHQLYKNIFLAIDEELNLILFTYPNIRTIKHFLKQKMKSIKRQSNNNLPNTYLPQLYRSKKYDPTLEEGEQAVDLFSNENLNMFMHLYKNVYVLSTLEGALCGGQSQVSVQPLRKPGIQATRREDVEVKEKRKGKYNTKKDKRKDQERVTFLREIKREEYIEREYYSNPSFKMLKICFFPSSICHFLYLSYISISENHYLLLTIVNLYSKPLYKYTIYIPINNVVDNKHFVDFFMNICSHIYAKSKNEMDDSTCNIHNRSIVNNGKLLQNYLSKLKMSVFNNSHILIYGCCILSMVEIKNYDLTSTHPYTKEYEYKYLKLLFTWTCHHHFTSIYDSYVNRLSHDLKHNLIINDLYQKKQNSKQSRLVYRNGLEKKEDFMTCSGKNVQLDKKKDTSKCTFYIFSLLNEVYLLTNEAWENSHDVLLNYEEWWIMKPKGSGGAGNSRLVRELDNKEMCTFQGVMNMNINYYYNYDYYKSNISLNSSIQATIKKYEKVNNNVQTRKTLNKPLFPDVYIYREMKSTSGMNRGVDSFYYNLQNHENLQLCRGRGAEPASPGDKKHSSYDILACTPLSHLDTILLLVRSSSREESTYALEFENIVNKKKKIIPIHW
ncbi:myosin D [Plasmodium ovale curtisi]|uniref:Myosin D n=1 Tax=Plasmodium ovale curtisi TaxID=864141 RepID=A0A1A8WAB7_PLAOA|nr:myosin D [Plasmodium ovale curtisi]